MMVRGALIFMLSSVRCWLKALPRLDIHVHTHTYSNSTPHISVPRCRGVRFAVGIPHSVPSAYTTLLASRSTHGPSFPFLLSLEASSLPSYQIKPNHIAIREVFSEHHEPLANSFSPLIPDFVQR
ncbi:hypothetical protein FA13DRAFT_1084621 [Coprinellus micaceus]|uniref:Secreted protein n=1 Tax=Coprinellus micaceus TaxID=71717 RepID=A0A4Y7TRJ3_COPMI|nr:hypothetical protein FA13DRAFT_1084621 [Coprinellus micaceus]